MIVSMVNVMEIVYFGLEAMLELSAVNPKVTLIHIEADVRLLFGAWDYFPAVHIVVNDSQLNWLVCFLVYGVLKDSF